MKIAFIPFLTKEHPEPLPPIGYGSVNRFVFHLSEELVRRGHDVTVFGPEGTSTSAHLISVVSLEELAACDQSTREGRDRYNGLRTEMQARILDGVLDTSFDIVHTNDFPKIAMQLRRRGLPLVQRMHSPPDSAYFRSVFSVMPDVAFHFVSARHEQLALEAGCQWSVGYAYHGVEVDRFPFGEGKGGYALYLGKIHETKGVAEAVQAAKKANVKIILAGPIKDQTYFDSLGVDGERVQYVGVADWNLKARLYKDASVFMHIANWEEPFGLTLAEAAACGTPVVGCDRGSVPEVVVDGKTGIIVPSGDIDAAAEGIQRVMKGEISREACRKRAETLFSLEQMGARYERLFSVFLQEREMRMSGAAVSKRIHPSTIV